MKRILVLAAIVMFSTLALTAQNQEPKIKTLFGDGKMTHSGYLGLQFKGTSFNDQLGFLVGGKGGWLINRKFTIGLAGYGSVPPKSFDNVAAFVNDTGSLSKSGKADRMFGYGGLYLEYILNPLDLIHFTGNILIGGGGVSYGDYSNMGNMDNDTNYNRFDRYPAAGYLVIEPEVSAEMNITRFAKVGIAASYRIATMIGSNEAMDISSNKFLKDMNMSGFAASLYFNFGWF